MGFLIRNISNRAESKVFIHELLYNRVSFAQSNVHLHSSLAVTDIVDQLVRHLINIGKNGW